MTTQTLEPITEEAPDVDADATSHLDAEAAREELFGWPIPGLAS